MAKLGDDLKILVELHRRHVRGGLQSRPKFRVSSGTLVPPPGWTRRAIVA
jgi:hypothetical protein